MTSFALRIPDHVMEQAKSASAEDKVSINQMLVAIIAEGLGHRRGMKMMRERATKADIGAALAILARAPDVAPKKEDEITQQPSPHPANLVGE